jgi:hypothetical protein
MAQPARTGKAPWPQRLDHAGVCGPPTGQSRAQELADRARGLSGFWF